MKIFKFGGASLANAQCFRNTANIIAQYLDEPLVVVVSAMGKTTNQLEELLSTSRNGGDVLPIYNQIRDAHFLVLSELFPSVADAVYSEVEALFFAMMHTFKLKDEDYDYHYDQMVGMGEMLSSTILSHYLSNQGVQNTWCDVRTCIATDSIFREGNVNWTVTERQIRQRIEPVVAHTPCVITQGFIGMDDKKRMTTLGREGSDYTAAIFAYCLQAKSMTIWKDVQGFLNADPRFFDNPQKIDILSYNEAIELAYYGASIIHPKTIKPLQNKQIPLLVKSFNNPEASGTVIHNEEAIETSKLTYYICKPNQVLFSIYPKDFSFIAEQNLSFILFVFAENNMKINLMQNAAVSFTVCVDCNKQRIADLVETLSNKFDVRYNEHLELVTVRHYRNVDIKAMLGDATIFLEQRNRTTAQFVVRGFCK
ncbi:aspartokinase [Bacteroidia bacterium]|nr:aspartokinase [Bacteroidia bacterium]